MIFQPELETLSRPELERLQLERLRERFGVGSLEELRGGALATKAYSPLVRLVRRPRRLEKAV